MAAAPAEQQNQAGKAGRQSRRRALDLPPASGGSLLAKRRGAPRSRCQLLTWSGQQDIAGSETPSGRSKKKKKKNSPFSGGAFPGPAGAALLPAARAAALGEGRARSGPISAARPGPPTQVFFSLPGHAPRPSFGAERDHPPLRKFARGSAWLFLCPPFSCKVSYGITASEAGLKAKQFIFRSFVQQPAKHELTQKN
ncbi:uncharacterized protein LOC120305935 isoform X2 [Crotalus tigris]|uniref:uncharacterized protein LOC120305935 isoform X2 n=1 Tax=Crotalus tigris TaxID=88082 RepID=UPI00192F8CE8|nr:uncharacterized protein LOC120305935 isoform X2 [Crotalus tigris]